MAIKIRKDGLVPKNLQRKRENGIDPSRILGGNVTKRMPKSIPSPKRRWDI